MMRQYRRIKAEQPDSLLFFRLGDFYELFGPDARTASALLGLTLTQRQGIPMCGVPHHAAATYLRRLLDSGRSVAICEQTSPTDRPGLVEREVVRVLSPGTIIDDELLADRGNNFLVSAARTGSILSLVWLDPSAGTLTVEASEDADPGWRLRAAVSRLDPAELLLQQSLLEPGSPGESGTENSASGPLLDLSRVHRHNLYPDWAYDAASSAKRISEALGLHTLEGFGVSNPAVLYAAGPLLDQLATHTGPGLGVIRRIRITGDESQLGLDETTVRNLELVHSLHGDSGTTLLSVLDRTASPMGKRLLHRWIVAPSRDASEIMARLHLVTHFSTNPDVLARVHKHCGRLGDLERAATRISVERSGPRELRSVADGLAAAAAVLEMEPSALHRPPPVDRNWVQGLITRIDHTLVEDPPRVLGDADAIRDGVDDELDAARRDRDHSAEAVRAYEDRECHRTGIRNLRVKRNRVLGYYLESPRSAAAAAPDHLVLRQTLAQVARFTSEELGEIESRLNGAGEIALTRERALFAKLAGSLSSEAGALSDFAGWLAELDVLAGLALRAQESGWTKPDITEEPVLHITEGRHPVVEARMPGGSFVPNDTLLQPQDTRFMLITGPNMAGKSTYLRQVALITVLAHIGSYVPASAARVGLCDRLFCRIGASDNIARGASTFLVEMTEAAHILNRASENSLVVMDEIGRGTGTADGRAIAQAICEQLTSRHGPRTLFATHFLELTSLALPGAANFRLGVRRSRGRVHFRRRLEPGPAAASYGLYVARIAGLPESVLLRAQHLMKHPEAAPGESEVSDISDFELESGPGRELQDLLTGVDPDALSPRDAHALLYRLVETLRGQRGMGGVG